MKVARKPEEVSQEEWVEIFQTIYSDYLPKEVVVKNSVKYGKSITTITAKSCNTERWAVSFSGDWGHYKFSWIGGLFDTPSGGINFFNKLIELGIIVPESDLNKLL